MCFLERLNLRIARPHCCACRAVERLSAAGLHGERRPRAHRLCSPSTRRTRLKSQPPLTDPAIFRGRPQRSTNVDPRSFIPRGKYLIWETWPWRGSRHRRKHVTIIIHSTLGQILSFRRGIVLHKAKRNKKNWETKTARKSSFPPPS